jgi:hypothetical protein
MFFKLFLIFIFFVFFSCTQEEPNENAENIPPVGTPIIGEPILSAEIDKNASTISLLGNESKIISNPIPSDGQDIDEESIEEGFIVNGIPKPNNDKDLNVSIVSNLPPLDENSEFERLAFRDMSNFPYDINWDRDGKEFDFTSYAKRVPKRLRDKTGASVAVEGFMLPTVVDENNKVTEFLLLPDQMSCCFGKSPEANGWVVVSATNGVEVLMDQIIRATGTLIVEERWDEEFFVGLYHLDCKEITGPSL